MVADIATGHHAAADVLFLIAAVVFAVEVIMLATARAAAVSRGVLPAAGLCLLAVAWLVL